MANINLNLLHIEDSLQDAHLIKKSLDEQEQNLHSYNITQVATMQDALKALTENNNYSAILLDLNLPDGHGIENIQSIKNMNANIPIIIVSGTTDEETALHALSHGAQEYIVKAHSSGHFIGRIIQSSIFRKRAEIELARKAYTDALTGLPNRAFFEHAARGMLERAKRNNREDALMFIDLNKFKQINDTLGHEAGNIVLQTAAERLKQALRASDLVARYAGDEFVIYMDSGKDPITEPLCKKIAQKIVRQIEKPIIINGNSLEISLSIGIALYPHAGESFEELLKNADAAMYRAKKDPKIGYCIIGKNPTTKPAVAKIIGAPSNTNKSNKTILIIDDSHVDRLIYKKMINKSSNTYNILEASSIKEGVAILEKKTPDCILLDYNLPDSTGGAFLRKIKEKGEVLDSAIIMITGDNDRETAVETMKNGAKDFIVKNEINADRLVQTIKNAIEKSCLEKDLRLYQKELERSNDELSEFAHIVAHDLKAPMRKIFMFCELLQEKFEIFSDADITQYIDRMSVSANRMEKLIDSLLSFSEVIHSPEEKKLTPLDQMTRKIIDSLDVWIKEQDTTIHLDDLPHWPVYSIKMQQLLTNLITNAIKYRDPLRKSHIEIKAGVKKDKCTITVKDNGIGIDQKYIDKIFVPFHRLHNADDIEGTGLGLAICKKIVDKHEGTISVSSKIGEGSTFTVSLPQ